MDQLLTLRQLKPFWVPFEAGGVLLATRLSDEDDGREPREEVNLILGRPLDTPLTREDQRRYQALLPGVGRTLRWFYANGQLAPGVYALPNHHRDEPACYGHLLRLPDAPTLDFTFTAEHAKLIRHLQPQVDTAGILATNLKRPYGSSTYFYPEMAEILGEGASLSRQGTLPADLEERYERLHQEMLLAIQALFLHGQVVSRADAVRPQEPEPCVVPRGTVPTG